MKNRMSYSIFVLAIIAALFSSSHALLKLDVSPIGTKLLSSKNANWDTVEVQVYVYNSGDTTYYNKGGHAATLRGNQSRYPFHSQAVPPARGFHQGFIRI